MTSPNVADIQWLMSLPEEEHDRRWLIDALRAALKLEFATIPPYLCALWSIKDQEDTIAQSIRSIVREEMGHYGMIANMLVGLGEQVQFEHPSAVPTYPGKLPGNVRPNIDVALQRLSINAARLFMEIEHPEFDPLPEAAIVKEYASIGEFYSAIENALMRLETPELDTTMQISGTLGIKKYAVVEEAIVAIHKIKQQGEGLEGSPEDMSMNDLAHFYRFREIVVGKKFVKDPSTGKWGHTGDKVELRDDAIFPMATIPLGGYQPSDAPSEVFARIQECDIIFTEMLQLFTLAWQSGDASHVTIAVKKMRELRDAALKLVAIPIEGSNETYGPCFRLYVE